MEVMIFLAVLWGIYYLVQRSRQRRKSSDMRADEAMDSQHTMTVIRHDHAQMVASVAAPAYKDPLEGLPSALIAVLAEIDAIDSLGRRDEDEDKREKLKDTERALRYEYRLRWSGETTVKPPIKSLTFHQARCLFWAERLYVIRPTWLEYFGPTSRNNSFHEKRTIESLLKHGLLSAHPLGHYEITDLGLQVLETLPQRSL